MEFETGELIWRIATGKEAKEWPNFLKQGCVGTDWSELDNFLAFETIEKLQDKLISIVKKPRGEADKIWMFAREMRIGDVIVANKGNHVVVGIGVVTSQYFSSNDPDNPMRGSEFPHIRKVNWLIKHPVTFNTRFFEQVPHWIEKLNDFKWQKILTAYQKEGVDVQASVRTLQSAVMAQTTVAALNPDASGLEGSTTSALRRHYERDSELRRQKIEMVLARDGRLRCEVPGCGFDFHARYGEHGRGYTHVHHLDPLCERDGKSITTLDRLAIVCANCHAMIHRRGECHDMDSLIPSSDKK